MVKHDTTPILIYALALALPIPGGCAAVPHDETTASATQAQREADREPLAPERAPCRVMRVDALAWHDGVLEVVGCGFAQLLEVRIYPSALAAPSRAVPWVAADDRVTLRASLNMGDPGGRDGA